MTSACQKKGREVTPRAYDDGGRRPEEWGRHNVDLSFPGEAGQHSDEDGDDDNDEAELLLQEDSDGANVNKVA